MDPAKLDSNLNLHVDAEQSCQKGLRLWLGKLKKLAQYYSEKKIVHLVKLKLFFLFKKEKFFISIFFKVLNVTKVKIKPKIESQTVKKIIKISIKSKSGWLVIIETKVQKKTKDK
jgi:hypothetical protein